MTQPADGPADLDTVKVWLSIPLDSTTHDLAITDAVDAVNNVVRGMRVAQLDGAEPELWPSRVVTGAVMLAGRVFRRRNTPDGVQTLTDQGAVYVSRSDPDVAQLLQLGSYAKPSVG